MKVKNILIVGLLLISGNLRADLYKWIDESGKVHFSDKKQNESSEQVIQVSEPNIDDSISKKDTAIAKESVAGFINIYAELSGAVDKENQYDAFVSLSKDQPDVAGKVLMNYRFRGEIVPVQARFKEENGKYVIHKDNIDTPDWLTMDAILDLKTKKLVGTFNYGNGQYDIPIKINLMVTKFTSYDRNGNNINSL